MKKTMIVSLVLVLALALSSCATLITEMGGYTADQYNAQVTQVADLTTQNGSLTTDNVNREAQIKDLTDDNTKLQDQADQLKDDIALLKTDLTSYKEIVCADHDWKDLDTTGVWFLSESDANLAQVEIDTQVNFYLTQWLPIGEVDNVLGATVLTVDYFNGIALDSANNCVILDPAKWEDIAK